MTILGNDVFADALEERLKEREIPLRILKRTDRPTLRINNIKLFYKFQIIVLKFDLFHRISFKMQMLFIPVNKIHLCGALGESRQIYKRDQAGRADMGI